MRIDSSIIGMESARSYRATSATVRRFTITDYQEGLTQGNNALDAAIGGDTGDAGNTENTENAAESSEKESVPTLQEWQNRFQVVSSTVTVRSSASQTLTDVRQATVRYIFELLFSVRRSRLNQWRERNNVQDNSLQSNSVQSESSQTTFVSQQSSSSGLIYQNGQLMIQPRPLVASLKVLNYSQETIQIEKEEASFSTVGTVRTADGREINFNVNVGMSREFQQTFRDELELASFTMCDPLVINLDTDVAELSDQTIFFDIDADGEKDEVSRLESGSGYLALDKNNDGTVNDGSELFGTASGDGFADLAEYDEDGNGWIDEGDDVWNKLQIWCKDENGRDVLYKLSDKGVGAICLQNASTDFTLKNQEGQTKGAIRSTGVFLYENGNVGTLQHVDVAKYDSQA